MKFDDSVASCVSGCKILALESCGRPSWLPFARDLLWAGISPSLMFIHSSQYSEWHCSYSWLTGWEAETHSGAPNPPDCRRQSQELKISRSGLQRLDSYAGLLLNCAFQWQRKAYNIVTPLGPMPMRLSRSIQILESVYEDNSGAVWVWVQMCVQRTETTAEQSEH